MHIVFEGLSACGRTDRSNFVKLLGAPFGNSDLGAESRYEMRDLCHSCCALLRTMLLLHCSDDWKVLWSFRDPFYAHHPSFEAIKAMKPGQKASSRNPLNKS